MINNEFNKRLELRDWQKMFNHTKSNDNSLMTIRTDSEKQKKKKDLISLFCVNQ